MTVTEAPYDREVYPYRAISKAAITSLILGVISSLGLAFPPFLILAALGLLLGIIALKNVYRYPEELSGKVPAFLGTLLSGLLVVGGTSLHCVIYVTEVPEGYLRISFADLQPSDERPDLPVPPAALELDGEQVFVKGYLYPDGQQRNIKRFVLVPDMGTCCFGGQPALTDMIEVTLEDPLRAVFARRKRKLGGILKVDTSLKPVNGLTGVYYQMTADYLK
jgi:hypothetical protein